MKMHNKLFNSWQFYHFDLSDQEKHRIKYYSVTIYEQKNKGLIVERQGASNINYSQSYCLHFLCLVPFITSLLYLNYGTNSSLYVIVLYA